MLRRAGRVLSRHGDSLELELLASSNACSSCARGCGLLSLGAGLRGPARACRLRVNATQEFSIGSQVAVELPATEVLRAAMLAYGLPLLGLGVGGLLAALFGPVASDLVVLSGAGFGLSLGVAVSRKRARVALLQPAAVALRQRD